jgi:hypothetical protein
MADAGVLLTEQGVPVVCDATANGAPTTITGSPRSGISSRLSDGRHPLEVAGFSGALLVSSGLVQALSFHGHFRTVDLRAPGIAELGRDEYARDYRETAKSEEEVLDGAQEKCRGRNWWPRQSLCPWRMVRLLALAPAARLPRVNVTSQEFVYVLISVSS